MRTKVDVNIGYFYKGSKKLKILPKDWNQQKYRSFIKEYNTALGQICLDSYFGISIPNIGLLKIKGFTPEKRPVIWNKSIVYNKHVTSFNTHSNGKMFRFFLNKKIAGIYKFKMLRIWNRALAKRILSGNYNYFMT